MTTAKSATIPVLEIFGPTIQGEGMVIGQKTMFIRTAGCDYKCAWCDSAFTWDGSAKDQIQQRTPQAIWQRLLDVSTFGMKAGEYGHDRNFNHVTISGGNPALIGGPMQDLIDLLHQHGIQVGLETQGSRWQDWFWDIDDLTISPKPPSSKMETNFEVLDQIIGKLSNPYEYDVGLRRGDRAFSLKTVVFNEADWEYAKKVHKRYPQVPFFVSVGNDDVQTMEIEHHNIRLLNKLGWLFEKIIGDPEMNDVRPLPQLHTLVWGNLRGV